MIFIKEYSYNELFLNIDANKIARAFENIIVNAIKYGDASSDIVIRVFENDNSTNFIFENKVGNSNLSKYQ